MSRITQILSNFSFSDIEVEIYLAVLALGRPSASEIARKVGKNRTAVYFHIKKLRADIMIGKQDYEQLLRQKKNTERTYQSLSHSPDTPHSFDEAKKLLEGFYTNQRTKWEQSPYTKEDITKNFSEEHLASLSLDDYALLLKRFPSEMVAHVTRQGVRDHTGHLFHSAGEGAYADGFMKMAEDGRLRSPLGVHLAEGWKEDAVADFLNLKRYTKKEEAQKTLNRFLDPTYDDARSGYVDRMAIHFATEEVADSYYGSEKGNEIFVAYQSAHVASQYYFNGQLTKAGGDYWNDQWVWANEERGMDLDSGIVFIPKNAQVDRETGSRYELDDANNPRKNEHFIEVARSFINDQNFQNLAPQLIAILGRFNQDWTDRSMHTEENQAARGALEPYRLQLEQQLHITDPRLQRALLDYNFLSDVVMGVTQRKNIGHADFLYEPDYCIQVTLKKMGILYTEAKNPITSQQFWEKYFVDHPNIRPSKIVYYEGINPTKALRQWRNERGIFSKAQDGAVGFEEKRVSRTSPEASSGADRFRSIAEKVIEDYFSAQPQAT